jgi:hypothetical protein
MAGRGTGIHQDAATSVFATTVLAQPKVMHGLRRGPDFRKTVGAEMIPPDLGYGRDGRKRRSVLICLMLLPTCYCLAYAGMRVSGRIRPFYNQGSFEMDSDDRAAILFLPLIDAEQAWHNAFTKHPTGG